MSQKANYFKLGLFVVGAAVAGVAVLLIIGSGRWFERKITVETYFNESVQGLDIGSKLKYRGVVIGEVTKITFTYVNYQQDLPMTERARYVMVEAQIQPRLVGGRAAAGDLTSSENAQKEVERGLRVRLAPQGITGTSYLEVDYVDPAPPVLPIYWTPTNVYIPSAPSTLTNLLNAATEIADRLHRLDVEAVIDNLNTLLTTANDRVASIDAKALSQRTEKALVKLEATLDQLQVKRVSDEAAALLAELRQSNAELRRTLGSAAFQKLPEETSATIKQMRELVSDPKIAATVAHLERSLSRMDRILGGGEADVSATIENLRSITDNLRDLTEDAKRYPSNVLFGAPPTPLPRTK